MNKITFPKIDLQHIKGVLIDIDDTLYAYEPAHEKALEKVFIEYSNKFQNQLSFFDFRKLYRKKRINVTNRLFPQGPCRSRLFAFQELFEEINISKPFNYALKFETLYWKVFIKNMERSEEAYKFLVTCKKSNISVCAVSDMQARFQIQKLQALGLDHYINYLVTSEETGSEKPISTIFKMALNKLKLKPREVIMIGDNQEKDIEGAQNMMIKAYQVKVQNYECSS